MPNQKPQKSDLQRAAQKLLTQVLNSASPEGQRIRAWRLDQSTYQANWSRAQGALTDAVRCKFDALFSADGQLGPLLRLAILIGLAPPEPGLAPLEPRFFAKPNPERRVRGVHPVKALDVLLTPSMELRWLAELINRLGKRAGLPRLSFEALMQTPVLPVDKTHDLAAAIAAYKAWLEEGWQWVAPQSTAPEALASREARSLFRESPEMLAMLHTVRELVGQSGAQRRPIVQLQARLRPGLSRVLAAELIKELRTAAEPPSVIVLDATPRLDMRVDPSDAAHEAISQWPVSMRRFLQPLADCFAVDLGPPWRVLSGLALRNVLDVLRHALAEHPCLVLVLGLGNPGGWAEDFVSGHSAYFDALAAMALPSLQSVSASRSLFLTCAASAVPSWEPYTALQINLDHLGFSEQTCKAAPWVSGGRRGRYPWPCLGSAAQQLTESVAAKLPPGLPSDVGLALLGAWLSFNRSTDLEPVQDEQGLADLWLRTLVAKKPALVLLLALLSSTDDGLSLSTLDRVSRSVIELLEANGLICAAQAQAWCAQRDSLLACADSPQASAALHHELKSGLAPVVVVVREQVGEYLSERVQRWELGELSEGMLSTGDSDGFRHLLRFAWPTLRELTRAAISSLDAQWIHRLALIDYALASEAFQQATAALTHGPSHEQLDLARKRLLMQSLLHLARAGELRAWKLADANGLPLGAAPFPVQNERRWRYAYAVLYRQLLEDRGAWVLSRRYGRPQLRLAALSALARWGRPCDLTSLLPTLGQSQRGFHRQILSGVAYAAVEAQNAAIAGAALAALADPLQQVHMGVHRVGLRLTRSIAEPATASLAFTVLDDAGELAQARRLCERSVDALAPGLRRELVSQGLLMAGALMTESDAPTGFRRSYGEIEQLLRRLDRDADPLLELADWLVRLADVKANAVETSSRLSRLIPAWLFFLAADRLRALVGERSSAQGRLWGRLNARYYRSGIRLSLKLARALDGAGAKDGQGLRELGRFAMRFTSECIAGLSRDYNALAVERLHVLLLRGAQIRTAARIQQDLRLLLDAAEYLEEAERLWVELGSPSGLTRRLLLERLSYREAEHHLGREGRLDTALADLLILEGFVMSAGSAKGFWARWMRRHQRRVSIISN